MNITIAKQRTENTCDGYNYNAIDAIFLAILLSLFDHPFFKMIRNKTNIIQVEKQTERWIEAYSALLNNFRKFWEDEGNGKSWGVIFVNIASLLYRFTLLSGLSIYSNRIDAKLMKIEELLLPLPEQNKIEIYEKGIKSSIDWILRNLEDYISKLKENNPDVYFDYCFYKRLREIDKLYVTVK